MIIYQAGDLTRAVCVRIEYSTCTTRQMQYKCVIYLHPVTLNTSGIRTGLIRVYIDHLWDCPKQSRRWSEDDSCDLKRCIGDFVVKLLNH